jgi:hypothetical protein
MEHIRAHLTPTTNAHAPTVRVKRKRLTERGELMRHFTNELNRGRARDRLELITMPRMGKILEAIPTSDLYYLKSVCDEAGRRGGSFSKRFWWEIDPKKHTEEYKKAHPFKAPSTKRGK